MNQTNSICLSLSEISIIKALLYSDIFKYPLKKEEIFQRLGVVNNDISSIQDQLNNLVQLKFIHQKDEFYSVNAIEHTERRIKGNIIAEKNFSKAFEIANLISKFPYIKAVFVSGSLSKNFMDEKSDIDFFIITEKNRMWIGRTLLILYKKIILLNNKEHFCLNYFIDTDHLEIPEKNLFTATEIVTVIPAFGKKYCAQFYEHNKWVTEHYPNHPQMDVSEVPDLNPNASSKIENFFSGKLGDWLDGQFMKLTLSFWKKKFKDIANEDFNLAMKTKKHASKHHPNNYQKKVLNQLDEFISDFEEKHNVSLSV